MARLWSRPEGQQLAAQHSVVHLGTPWALP